MSNDNVNYSEPEIIAQKLLWPLWRGIDDGFKEKYVRDIWNQFENNVRSAAYTSKLSRFMNWITTRLGIELQAQFVDDLNEFLKNANDKEVLKIIREQSTLCVLLVRKINEERKQSYQNKKS